MAPKRHERVERLAQAGERDLDTAARTRVDLLRGQVEVREADPHRPVGRGSGCGAAGVDAAPCARGSSSRFPRPLRAGLRPLAGESRLLFLGTRGQSLDDAHRIPVREPGFADAIGVALILARQPLDHGLELPVLPRVAGRPPDALLRGHHGDPVALAQLAPHELPQGHPHGFGRGRRDVRVVEEDVERASLGRCVHARGRDPRRFCHRGDGPRGHDHRLERLDRLALPAFLDDEVVLRQADDRFALAVEDDDVEANDLDGGFEHRGWACCGGEPPAARGSAPSRTRDRTTRLGSRRRRADTLMWPTKLPSSRRCQ